MTHDPVPEGNPKVRIISERCVFEDHFQIYEARLSVLRFDGTWSPVHRRLKFERGDSVAAVLFKPQTQTVILINQFRYPSYTKGDGWLIELVAGTCEDGETVHETMRREISEETGYSVGTLQEISKFYVSPGGTSERIALFYAEIDAAPPHPDASGMQVDNENIKVVEVTLSEACQMLDRSEIVDAKTIIGLQWLRAKVQETAT
jgi:ADP-ribose pyrophosphatase